MLARRIKASLLTNGPSEYMQNKKAMLLHGDAQPPVAGISFAPGRTYCRRRAAPESLEQACHAAAASWSGEHRREAHYATRRIQPMYHARAAKAHGGPNELIGRRLRKAGSFLSASPPHATMTGTMRSAAMPASAGWGRPRRRRFASLA